MFPWRALSSSFTACVVLALCGCNGDGLSEVKGAVTFESAPVEKGSIMFIPADGKSAVTGAAIEAGRYSARVPSGAMKVVISMPKVVSMKKLYDTPDSKSMPVTAEALPKKYSDREATILQVEVGGRALEKDFTLTK